MPALALATLASGPCDCPPFDECYNLSELRQAREDGVAKANGSPSADTFTVLTAKSWDGESCPDTEQYAAIARLSPESGLASSWQPESAKREAERCCYHFIPSCDGRPFLVRGSARVARLIGSPVGAPHPELAAAWLADALAEHASVAAFARLSLQLLAHGAPLELVERAQEASLDEVRHARFCFERAATYGGGPYLAGALPLAGALEDDSLSALIEANLLEGCIGETLACERLRCRAEHTRDEALRAALLAIAEEEQRHAELAFAILAWCRELSPALTLAVTERVLAGIALPAPPIATAPTDELFTSERGAAQALAERDRDVYRDVLLPLLRANCSAAAA